MTAPQGSTLEVPAPIRRTTFLRKGDTMIADLPPIDHAAVARCEGRHGTTLYTDLTDVRWLTGFVGLERLGGRAS